MVMDPGISELSGILTQVGVDLDEYYADNNFPNWFELADLDVNQNVVDQSYDSRDSRPSNFNPDPSMGLRNEGSSPEDSEIFSDLALNYISQMLMQEDMEEKNCMYHESSALLAKEKSFYEIIGEKTPPSTDQYPPSNVDLSAESPEDNLGGSNSNYFSGSSSCLTSSHSEVGPVLDGGEYQSDQNVIAVSTDYTSQSSFSSSNSVTNVSDGLDDSPTNLGRGSDFLSESLSAWHVRKGFEEAIKFLPNSNNFIIDLENNGFLFQEPQKGTKEVTVKVEEKEARHHSVNELRGKKNPHGENIDWEEGRSNKHSAVYSDTDVRSEIFDLVLLCTTNGKPGPAMSTIEEWSKQIVPPNGVSKNSQNGQTKGSSGAKSRSKKQGKPDVVDLRTLLVTCAQAVAADDRRTTKELLKQIRQHSSPFGDGSQRLAHCFADGLEARLAGTGSQIYNAFLTKRTTAADILKAHHLYMSTCPFKKISFFFSNQTIIDAVENKSKLHIVDFGVYYGFQWPCLMNRLSNRPGGPPKLRITGIDLPQPGFRPAERVEETGRRLADYAKSFNIPFEFIPIACKWETIQVEDIKTDEDEVLVVNSLYCLKTLADETVVVDCPRNIVLNTIRKLNPNLFIHGIVNGSYGAPFFITRFREALFHYSACFDMLESNIPREHPERAVIENHLFGREALNVISCEGLERVERPETYKQWHVRNLRAGFEQLPLNPDIMKKARDKVKSSYHKDFVIDEDSQWMLQGWKGRIIYALSTWRPVRRGF